MNVSSSTVSQMFQTVSSSSTRNTSTLSTEQQELLEEVLSDYDTDNLSSDDASSIVQALSEAGIEESQALTEALSTAGFDAQEIGNLAQTSQSSSDSRPMGPPPPPPEEEVDSVSSLLESLLSSDEESDDTTTSSTTTDSSSLDTVLDYTAKIMSLKDDAKTEVMDILEQYNSEDNELSQEDTEKFIVNSLSQILGESDNYNTISFYA